MSGYGVRLRAAVVERGNLCAGIDPHSALLEAWGLPETATGVREFGLRCADAFAAEVAVIKPQVAFFEAFGSAGIAALEDTIAACRAAGAVVIADAKRGDIGTTMAAYASAWLGDGPLGSDALTVSPYLGFGALDPAIALAERNDRGIFMLARTSNPEGIELQKHVAQDLVDRAGAANALRAKQGGDDATIGLVIGATADHGLDLTGFVGPILIPGLGAQGGTPEQVRRIFGDRELLLPAASRSILAAGPDSAALREAALRTRDEVAAALG